MRPSYCGRGTNLCAATLSRQGMTDEMLTLAVVALPSPISIYYLAPAGELQSVGELPRHRDVLEGFMALT